MGIFFVDAYCSLEYLCQGVLCVLLVGVCWRERSTFEGEPAMPGKGAKGGAPELFYYAEG